MESLSLTYPVSIYVDRLAQFVDFSAIIDSTDSTHENSYGLFAIPGFIHECITTKMFAFTQLCGLASETYIRTQLFSPLSNRQTPRAYCHTYSVQSMASLWLQKGQLNTVATFGIFFLGGGLLDLRLPIAARPAPSLPELPK